MNLKGLVKSGIKKFIKEGFDEVGRPDLKYYAFDWDDNIMFMPTSIMVVDEDENEVPMSTEDFAEYRSEIGVEPFDYRGKKIIGYALGAFRNFKEPGNKRFILDSMMAKTGPAWKDFVECINGGSIFAIITARGHSPETLKEATYNLIMSNKEGINTRELAKNLNEYRKIGNKVSNDTKIEALSPSELNEYLDMCVFEPVSFNKGSASNPEIEKFNALKNFISYCRDLAKELSKNMELRGTPMFKNDVNANPIWEPLIGFSDDDLRNIEKISELLNQEYEENPVNLYLTKGGEKVKY
jgi:hypothetical protein